MNKLEYVIREDGKVMERTITERDLEVEAEVMEAFTSDVTRSMRNVLHLPDWGMVHANVGLTDTIWSIPIKRLPLKARFRVINGVLVPMFASTTDLEMPVEWQCPKEIQLVLVVRTIALEKNVEIEGNWLFAFHHDRNAYRLPLPNLHDDCSICMGEFNRVRDSAAQCLSASLEQFAQSKWNSDLMRTVEKSQKFFRFKPTDQTFETLPIDAPDWTSLCDKVSTSIVDRIIL